MMKNVTCTHKLLFLFIIYRDIPTMEISAITDAAQDNPPPQNESVEKTIPQASMYFYIVDPTQLKLHYIFVI